MSCPENTCRNAYRCLVFQINRGGKTNLVWRWQNTFQKFRVCQRFWDIFPSYCLKYNFLHTHTEHIYATYIFQYVSDTSQTSLKPRYNRGTTQSTTFTDDTLICTWLPRFTTQHDIAKKLNCEWSLLHYYFWALFLTWELCVMVYQQFGRADDVLHQPEPGNKQPVTSGWWGTYWLFIDLTASGLSAPNTTEMFTPALSNTAPSSRTQVIPPPWSCWQHNVTN